MFSDIVYHSFIGIIIQTFIALIVLLCAFVVNTVWLLDKLPIYYARTSFEIASIIPLTLLLNKDFYGAQSVMKRIWGYKIVDYQTGDKVNEFQCMVRNISIVLFPLEALFCVVSPDRRLGDFLAGTRVVEVEPKSSKALLTEMREKKFNQRSWLTIAAALLIAYVIFTF